MATVFSSSIEELGGAPTEMLIGGEWREAEDGGTIPKLNPVNEEPLADVAAATAGDVDRAVKAAREAFQTWRKVPGTERARLMRKLAQLIQRDGEKLARIQSLENGVASMVGQVFDVPNAINTLMYFAGWADKIEGTVVPTDPFMGRDTHAYITRQPLGVIGAIIPWNAPLGGTIFKLAPALAAGCTVVLKPAEDGVLAPLYVGKLIEEAGFPAGVVNIVPGAGDMAGAALAAHHDVDMISFTGSQSVGREISKICAETFTKVALELGGKSPQLIFADADLAAAVQGTATGLFVNQGQVCAAATRILAERPVYEAVVEGLGQAAAAVRLGDPDAPDVDMGPLINRDQFERVNGYIEVGKFEGARVVAGGVRHEGPGYFVQPTIFADASNDMRIAREEIFGPVGTVIPFDIEEEAIAIANDTLYGLTATAWTADMARANRCVKALRSGTVWVNGWGALSPALPWGGYRQSGNGSRDLGLSGLLEHTEEKVVRFVI